MVREVAVGPVLQVALPKRPKRRQWVSKTFMQHVFRRKTADHGRTAARASLFPSNRAGAHAPK